MNGRLALGIALALAVVAAAVLAWRAHLDASSVSMALAQAGALAPLLFIGTFAAGSVILLPGAVFGLAGGALFGPLWGAACNLVGATLGASVAFLLARYLGGDWVARKAQDRLEAILAGFDAEGWRFVALMRLAPIVPFNVLNYALGLTRIPLPQYVAATFVCMLPGAAAYAWLGHAGRAALAGDAAALRYGLLGLGVLALIAFLPGLVRRMARSPADFTSVQELGTKLAEGYRPVVVDVREPAEFHGGRGHIPGAINIPLGELAARCGDLRHQRGPVVLVCRTDRRSAQAAAILRRCGLGDVRVLAGGMEAWSRQ